MKKEEGSSLYSLFGLQLGLLRSLLSQRCEARVKNRSGDPFCNQTIRLLFGSEPIQSDAKSNPTDLLLLMKLLKSWSHLSSFG